MPQNLTATIKLIALCWIGFALLACSSLVYQPDHVMYDPPEKFGLQPEEVSFKSRNGVNLGGWFFHSTKPGKPLGTIVQFHGNAENRTSHYVTLAWLLHEGYNLFTFDYAGYGDSEGEPSQKQTYLDGLAALDQGLKMHLQAGGGEFFVVGQSLGGAIAARVLNDWPSKDQVRLLVLDSTFDSYSVVARRILERRWFTWPLSPLGWLFVSNEYGSADALAQNKAPLLVMHDQRDPVVPFSCGQEVFAAAGGPKEFWSFDQGRHVGEFIMLTKDDGARENRGKFLQALKAH